MDGGGLAAGAGGLRRCGAAAVALRRGLEGATGLGSFREPRGRWLRAPFGSGWGGGKVPRAAGERRREWWRMAV